MKKIIIAALAALALSAISVQAEEAQPVYSDYNKALLKIGVDPETAAVVSQIALTKVQDLQLEKKQGSNK